MRRNGKGRAAADRRPLGDPSESPDTPGLACGVSIVVLHAKAEKLERGEDLETDRMGHACCDTLEVDHGNTARNRGEDHERTAREGELEARGWIPEGAEARGGIGRRDPRRQRTGSRNKTLEAKRGERSLDRGRVERQEGKSAAKSRGGWLSGETLEERTPNAAVERNKSTKHAEEQTVESARNAEGGT